MTYSRIRENQASPRKMLKIMIYAYMNGLYSSRSIENACRRDANCKLKGNCIKGHNCKIPLEERTKKLETSKKFNHQRKADLERII